MPLASINATRLAEQLKRERKTMDGWRPIETAPRDGTVILIYVADGYAVTGLWADDVEDFYKSQEGWASYDPDNKMGTWVSYGLPSWDEQARLFCGQTPTHWMPLPSPPETGE